MEGGQAEGIGFDFGDGMVEQLAPGQRVLVVENVSAFEARYGTGLPVSGAWSGGLSNGEEQLTLVVEGETLQQFRYRDDWHPTTDGGGYSLEILNERSDELGQWGEAAGWLPSIVRGGTPGEGRSAAEAESGDLNLDGTTDEADLGGLLLGLTAPEQYAARYGVPASLAGDTDGDGDLDYDDIPRFVSLISGGGEAGTAVAVRGVEVERAERRRLKTQRDVRAEANGLGKVTQDGWADLADRALSRTGDWSRH
jgi:hypothetical protein